MWAEESHQPALEAEETQYNFSGSRRVAGNSRNPTEFQGRHDKGFRQEEQPLDVQQIFSVSVGGTLERGAHHQALDLSEELPVHHNQHQHHQNQHLHHSNSLASTAVVVGRETSSCVVVPPPYCVAETVGSESPLELRGSLDCWACSVLVTAQNLLIAAINACLATLVFGAILTPATAMVVFGFLCHSTVRPNGNLYCSDLLNDGGCVALLVVGFLLVTPLLVLALAAYCRLARHLQLGLCFIPYSRAVYKNLPASQHHGLGSGCCCGHNDDKGIGKVWV